MVRNYWTKILMIISVNLCMSNTYCKLSTILLAANLCLCLRFAMEATCTEDTHFNDKVMNQWLCLYLENGPNICHIYAIIISFYYFLWYPYSIYLRPFLIEQFLNSSFIKILFPQIHNANTFVKCNTNLNYILW